MRTLNRLIAAAGIVGAIAATGGTAAVAQGVYLQGPGFGVDIGRLLEAISPRTLRVRASLA
jgi:hypothetical protein